MESLSRVTLAQKAAEFLQAYYGPSPLVLPNIWDAASAHIVEEAGFTFAATSSRAIAAVLGLQDNDSSDPDVVFDFLARIAAVLSCPLTADCEAGYRLSPAEFVDRLLGAGVVGCNLEDTDHHGTDALVNAEEQAELLSEER